MRCVKPFVSGKAAYGCGQCMPCRLTKRRTWTHRLMLEKLDHAESSFVTLTYSPETVPSEGSVVPEHVRDWLKRLRKRVHPRRLRYFIVGEYGDQSYRPHYHAALFGFPQCSAGYQRFLRGECPCPACSAVRETWNFGHVMVAPLEMKCAQYIAGYCVKKMTHRLDIRLGGKHPEFARMSLKPGIGATAMHNVASEMMRYSLEMRGDVPVTLRHGDRMLPLGRYLRGKLREMVDSDPSFKESDQASFEKKLRILRTFAWQNDRSVSSVFEEINGPYARALEGRERVNYQRGSL